MLKWVDSIAVLKRMKISKILKEYIDPIHQMTGKKDIALDSVTVHFLKTLRPYFNDVVLKDEFKRKTFEVRKNDRNYQVGEYLVLQEYISVERYIGSSTHETAVNDAKAIYGPHVRLDYNEDNVVKGIYTGKEAVFAITYILDNIDYIQPGWVIMGIKEVK